LQNQYSFCSERSVCKCVKMYSTWLNDCALKERQTRLRRKEKRKRKRIIFFT
jgi:hypothetical protein